MEILNIKQNMSTYKPLFNIFLFQSICLRAAVDFVTSHPLLLCFCYYSNSFVMV